MLDCARIDVVALFAGLLQVIGATTNEEYRKYVEKDKAAETSLAVGRHIRSKQGIGQRTVIKVSFCHSHFATTAAIVDQGMTGGLRTVVEGALGLRNCEHPSFGVLQLLQKPIKFKHGTTKHQI